MTDSTDHVTGKTGLTLTITSSKAGAAFASISPTVTERSNGWYQVALTTSHTDTLGDFALHVTGSGADPADMLMQVESQSLSSIGKSAFLASELAIGTVTSQTVFVLTGGPANDIANVMAIFFDASASNAPVVAEGSYVGSTGTLTLTAATGITVTTSDTVTLYAVAANTLGTDAISAAAVSAAAVTKIQTGLATPTNITAGTITTVTNLTNAPTAGDLTATMKTSVTTAATAATPTIASVSGAVGSVTGNIGGNVVGSVGSVLGGINTTSGTITTLDALDTAQDTQHGTTQTAVGSLPTAAVIADAVWDELVSEHVTDDSFGASVLIIGVGYTHTSSGSGGAATATITKA